MLTINYTMTKNKLNDSKITLTFFVSIQYINNGRIWLIYSANKEDKCITGLIIEESKDGGVPHG